jgi:hypothetical protein
LEATRPTPVDLRQLAVGEERNKVIQTLGAATGTVTNNNDACDVYQLYTRGPDNASKAALATGEAVSDVLTLGLAEVVWTPVEVGTRNQRHTVVICYDGHQQVANIKQSD